MCTSSASPSRLAALPELLDREVDLVRHEEVQTEDIVRRLARPSAIEPFAVAQLVALPGLADGQPGEQRQQRGEQRRVSVHARSASRHERSNNRVPAALGAQNQLEKFPGRARAAGRRARSSARVRALPARHRPARAARPTRDSTRDVHDVVAHVGDVLVGQADVARGCRRTRRSCSATPWCTSVMPSCAARSVVVGDSACRQQPDLQADALRPHHDDAVADVELLALAAVAVQHDAAVGQDAVDVEQHEPNPRGPFLDRTLNHELLNRES